MNTVEVDAAAVRGRRAVAAMFFVNGFLLGSWAPQIPVLLTRLEIRETTVGLLLLCFGLGAIVAMPWCGYLMSRHGSRRVLQAFATLSTVALLIVALSGNVWLAAVALLLFGGLMGGTDVAMNTSAVAVERRMKRAIMSSSHGFWSLGGFFGGGLGGLAIQNFGYLAHAGGVTVVAMALVAVALPHIVSDPAPKADATKPKTRAKLPTNPAIYLIGTMALLAMIPEGAVLDWAAIYLQQELGSDIATAGFAFAAFSATMALMRFVGDGVRGRLGAVATFRVSSLVAAAGMLVASLAPHPWLAIAAFAFAGLGIANMVPIAFSAAGNQKDMASGTGLSVATTMGYSGILVAPSAIGFIGERIGFAPIYLAVAVLLVVVCLMAELVRSADFVKPLPAE
jgi:predicted MFS family arabinose efflux permease